jgi:HD-like signal output (HDOD) protein
MQTAPSALADDAVLAALLHKIGYWILLQERSAELERALDLSRAERIPMREAETRILGASHAQIGAYLLGIWGLPQSIVTAVAHHLAPEQAGKLESSALEALIAARSGADETAAFRPPS